MRHASRMLCLVSTLSAKISLLDLSSARNTCVNRVVVTPIAIASSHLAKAALAQHLEQVEIRGRIRLAALQVKISHHRVLRRQHVQVHARHAWADRAGFSVTVRVPIVVGMTVSTV